MRQEFVKMIEDRSDAIFESFEQDKMPVAEWDLQGLCDAVNRQFNTDMDVSYFSTPDLDAEKACNIILQKVMAKYGEQEAMIGEDEFRKLEKFIMLRTVDTLWKEHLLNMDHLKEGIGLRSYAQQNPLVIYKKEGYEMFQELIERIKGETLEILFRIQMVQPDDIQRMQRPRNENLILSRSNEADTREPVKRTEPKTGRNDSCPCGSGKKYKKCCGV
ncbi:MAG: SEC-C domain-containing protein [Desulfamplus sp.]|nr:SEC-C domain-containing protein [Desulfamplus sp.]